MKSHRRWFPSSSLRSIIVCPFTLKVEIFSTEILILEKKFIILYLHILIHFILDLYAHKNAKYLFYRFNDYIKMSAGKRKAIKHTIKVKDLIVPKKIEERDRQFLVKKINSCC